MTPAQRFAEDYKLTDEQVGILAQQARLAAKASEAVHNSGNQKAADEWQRIADRRIATFEVTAKRLGFDGVDWPGLYPTVTKGSRQFIELPLESTTPHHKGGGL